jgi:hypothetical protein
MKITRSIKSSDTVLKNLNTEYNVFGAAGNKLVFVIQLSILALSLSAQSSGIPCSIILRVSVYISFIFLFIIFC